MGIYGPGSAPLTFEHAQANRERHRITSRHYTHGPATSRSQTAGRGCGRRRQYLEGRLKRPNHLGRSLVEMLLRHREVYGVGLDGLVFHRNGKPFDPDMFNKSVWRPARAALWPLRTDIPADDPRQPKLAKLRRHDLRHAACSWWLREGVDAVVCQRWSGHKTLSVFLDIYQGVAPGREEDGIAKLSATGLAPLSMERMR